MLSSDVLLPFLLCSILKEIYKKIYTEWHSGRKLHGREYNKKSYIEKHKEW